MKPKEINNIIYKLDKAKRRSEAIKTKKLRSGILAKFFILSWVLLVIFWGFYAGYLSRYFALVCAMIFAMFTLYFGILLRKNYKEIREIKKEGSEEW